MRIPSFSWAVMLYSWLLPALFLTAKAASWAATSVMLLYFLLQNSGWLLQAAVFMTGGALLVPVAVMVRFEFPLICVNSFVFVVRVICELEVAEAVPFSELSVKVRSPETKMRGPVLVTVLWPESVTYVNFEPLKSVTGMVVLMVDRSELVNSNAVYSALLELLDLEEEDDEESVCVAVVETPVPVPVSSCALAPRAARHSTHTCRDNMIVPPMLELSSRKMRRAGGERTTLRTFRGRWWMS